MASEKWNLVFLCVIVNIISLFLCGASANAAFKWEDNEEIQIFREYLRIQTVQPNVDYKPAVAFLQRQASSLSLPMSIHYPVDKENPVVVITLEGSQPELPSIMLNSHMDVVPVFPELWKHPPFEAVMEENGDIYARGAQDMKSVGMQYLAAIRALRRDGVNQFKRTIHVVFVPDEEVGGQKGMVGFVKSEAFKAMNVGLVLDEGSPPLSYDGVGPLNVYYGERTNFPVDFIFRGQSGHGSVLFEGTPGEKLSYVLGKLMEYRKEESRKLHELKYPFGNVTTINLTVLKGGVENNVIPAEMNAHFDMRLSINLDLDEFKEQIETWCKEGGENITIVYQNNGEKEKLTPVDDSNPFWTAFKKAVDDFGIQVIPEIMPGNSDSRYIRRLNISAFGFSPLMNTIPRLHDNNEYLNAETYLTGIEIYKKIIQNVADATIFIYETAKTQGLTQMEQNAYR